MLLFSTRLFQFIRTLLPENQIPIITKPATAVVRKRDKSLPWTRIFRLNPTVFSESELASLETANYHEISNCQASGDRGRTINEAVNEIRKRSTCSFDSLVYSTGAGTPVFGTGSIALSIYTSYLHSREID